MFGFKDHSALWDQHFINIFSSACYLNNISNVRIFFPCVKKPPFPPNFETIGEAKSVWRADGKSLIIPLATINVWRAYGKSLIIPLATINVRWSILAWNHARPLVQIYRIRTTLHTVYCKRCFTPYLLNIDDNIQGKVAWDFYEIYFDK